MGEQDLGLENRLRLRKLLTDILGTTGQSVTRTYFQPPSSEMMQYPCIIYERSEIKNGFADNGVYIQNDMYQLTVVDEDPDSQIVRAVARLPRCKHNRHFSSDNLNHDVFTIHI